MHDSQLTITQSGDVRLTLEGGRRIFLGCILSDAFHCERDLARHLHRKSNSLGFNHRLFKYGTFRRVSVVLTDGTTLETTRRFALAHGRVLNFKDSGNELQLFLPLEYFGRERAESWERIQDQADAREAERAAHRAGLQTSLALGA